MLLFYALRECTFCYIPLYFSFSIASAMNHVNIRLICCSQSVALDYFHHFFSMWTVVRGCVFAWMPMLVLFQFANVDRDTVQKWLTNLKFQRRAGKFFWDITIFLYRRHAIRWLYTKWKMSHVAWSLHFLILLQLVNKIMIIIYKSGAQCVAVYWSLPCVACDNVSRLTFLVQNFCVR